MEPSIDLLLSMNKDFPGGFVSASEATEVGGGICTADAGPGTWSSETGVLLEVGRESPLPVSGRCFMQSKGCFQRQRVRAQSLPNG